MDDLVKTLKNLEEFGHQFQDIDVGQAVVENAKLLAATYAMRELRTAARVAIAQTEEFQYPALEEQLLRNLADPRHYKCGMSLYDLQIFDEDVGGTYEDLIAGQQAAWNSTKGTQAQRLFCWTYGIYKPTREGSSPHERFADYPSYSAIIATRLATWGDKAPYWYFLEHGNAGGSPAYPSFGGTNFIANVRGHVRRLCNIALDVAAREMEASLEAAVDDQLEAPEKRVTKVYIGRVAYGTIAGKLLEVEVRASVTGTWYRLVIGGKYGERIKPGALLPTGVVFSP